MSADEKPTIDITQTVAVRLPMIPNHIMIMGGDSRHISQLDDETLRKIGEAWTEKLIETAREKRMNKGGM